MATTARHAAGAIRAGLMALGMLLLAACSGGEASVPAAPDMAMQVYADETARIRGALSDKVECHEEIKPGDPGEIQERHYYCLSSGQALASNLLSLHADDRDALRLYIEFKADRADAAAARDELAHLLAAYGYASSELDRCAKAPETDVSFASYRVNCTTHGISGSSFDLAVVPAPKP